MMDRKSSTTTKRIGGGFVEGQGLTRRLLLVGIGSLLLLHLAAASSGTFPGRTAFAPRSISSSSSSNHRRRRHHLLSLVNTIRGGADVNGDEDATPPSVSQPDVGPIVINNPYEIQLEAVKSRVLKRALEAIADVRIQIEQGEVVDGLGSQADAIVNSALQDFALQAPDAGDDVANSAVYDRTLQALEATVDAPLHVLYLKQLGLLRDAALQRFRSATRTSSVSDYEAMLQADSQFVSQAQQATRSSGVAATGETWDYSAERSFLQAVLNNLAESGRKISDVRDTAAQQSQTAMQFLQSQQQMIQQLQMQLYGQSSPWNVGVAYRIPDTNFNVQGTYQQGRANVQLSCVPDEYAPFLGPNGFTNGVGPGNLGLSLNLSV
jgi:hypothetical protein